MPLNFTGRAQPATAEQISSPNRTPVVLLGCFGAAAVLGSLVFAVALRQHKVDAPNPPPALVGTDRTLISAPPRPAVASPAEALAPQAVAQPVPPPAAAPAAPARLDPATAKARMLAALRQVPHGTVTLSVEDDAGAQAYAERLAALFREAGWRVDQASAYGPGPPRRGLAAAFGVSPSDEAVRQAFEAVGVRFALPPAAAGVIRTPEIYVGAP